MKTLLTTSGEMAAYLLFPESLDGLISSLRVLLLALGVLWMIALIVLAGVLIGSFESFAQILSGLNAVSVLSGAAIAVLIPLALLSPVLFGTPESNWQIVILTAGALGLLVVVLLGGLFVTAFAPQMRKSVTGKESMIGMVGTVRQPVSGAEAGMVFVNGERWQAILKSQDADTLPIEAEVEVIGFKREALVVQPAVLPARSKVA